MLRSSFLKRIEKESEASTDTTNLSLMLLVEKDAKTVGFVQVGMLPPPPGFHGEKIDTNEIQPSVFWNGVPISLPSQKISTDVPYIANLCVVQSCRRSGFGKKMVDICIKWLIKRQNQDNNKTNQLQNVFIAVESDNLVAQEFYHGMGFTRIEPSTKASVVGLQKKREYYYRPISSSLQGEYGTL